MCGFITFYLLSVFQTFQPVKAVHCPSVEKKICQTASKRKNNAHNDNLNFLPSSTASFLYKQSTFELVALIQWEKKQSIFWTYSTATALDTTEKGQQLKAEHFYTAGTCLYLH